MGCHPCTETGRGPGSGMVWEETGLVLAWLSWYLTPSSGQRRPADVRTRLELGRESSCRLNQGDKGPSRGKGWEREGAPATTVRGSRPIKQTVRTVALAGLHASRAHRNGGGRAGGCPGDTLSAPTPKRNRTLETNCNFLDMKTQKEAVQRRQRRGDYRGTTPHVV